MLRKLLILVTTVISTALYADAPYIWGGQYARDLAPKGDTEPAGTSALPSYTFLGDLGTGMWNDGAHGLGLSTNGTQAVEIGSNQRVGIGQVVPTTKLDITGDSSGAINVDQSQNNFILNINHGQQQLTEVGNAKWVFNTGGVSFLELYDANTSTQILADHSRDLILGVNGSSAGTGVKIIGSNIQTSDLLDIQDSTPTTKVLVDSSGNMAVGSTTATSMFNVGSNKFQVDSSGNILKINNVATSFPASQGAASTFLQNNGSGVLSWTASTTGTVTSVDLSVPGIFTVSGNPVTTSGTLAVTAAGTSGGIPYFSGATSLASSGALTANAVVIGGGVATTPTVVANNSTGTNKFLTQSSSATPAWGTIASGDVPNLAASKITSGTLAVAQGGTNLASGTSGGVLAYTGSGTLASSAQLNLNELVIGGGAGAVPTTVAINSTGTRKFLLDVSSATPTWDTVQSGDLALNQYNVPIGNSSNVSANTNTNLIGDIQASTTTGTVTITNASPGVITWTGNTLRNGQTLYFTTTGALPTGITASTTYYVSSLAVDGANKFRISATLGGAEVNTSSAGSGTHSAFAGGLQLNSGIFRDYITVDTGNGFGSTNTHIRRFTTARLPGVGLPAFTYADSATAGGSITVNTAGLYFTSVSDRNEVGTTDIGITVNSTAAPQGLNSSNLICITDGGVTAWGSCSGMFYFNVNDVVRVSESSTANGNTGASVMWVFYRVH